MRSDHKAQPSIASSHSRAARTSAAIRQGKIVISGPIPIDDNAATRPGTEESTDGRTSLYSKSDTWPRRSTLPALQSYHPIEQKSVHTSHYMGEDFKRASTFLTGRKESLTSLPSGISRRKSKGLRATLRKIFGNKHERTTPPPSFQDHRSIAEHLVPDYESTSHRSLRKPSLVFDEVIRGGGLNCHAPSPPTPASSHQPAHDYFRPINYGSRRRNSLPSVILSPEEAESLRQNLNDQGMAKDGKDTKPNQRRRMTRKLLDNARRRSRSADALREMAESQNDFQAQERRLSEEIKYWRNSIMEDPIPVLSTYQRVEEPASEPLPVRTPALAHAKTEVETPASQGLDFRNFMTGDDDASVAQRVTTVEVKLADLECAIANLKGHVPATAVENQHRRPPAPRAVTAPNIMPKSSFDSFSSGSSSSQQSHYAYHDNRKSVADTLRPSQPIYADDVDMNQLKFMFIQERAARKALEVQFRDLQNQIQELRFPSGISPGVPSPPATAHYSTPTQANGIIHSSSRIPAVARTSNKYTTLPYRPASPRLASFGKVPTPRVRETEAEDENEVETDTDDGFLESYETPTDAAAERGFGFGVSAGHLSSQMVGVI